MAETILVPHGKTKDCLGPNCKNCQAAIEFMDWIEGMPFTFPSWFYKSRRKQIEDLLLRWIELKRYVPPADAVIPGYEESDEEVAADPGPSASAPVSEEPGGTDPETTRVRLTAAELARMQMESEAAVTAQRRMQRDQQRQERSREQPSAHNPVSALLPDTINIEDHGNGKDASVVNAEVPGVAAPRGDRRKGRGGRSNGGNAQKKVRIREPPADSQVVAAPMAIVSRVSGRTVQPTEKAADSQVVRNISGVANHVSQPAECGTETQTMVPSNLLE